MIRKSSRTNYARVISFLFIAAVWITWFFIHGTGSALSNLKENWEIAFTMIFGSMVAGGTSMGGGAVAFPVMTKVLEISPYEAKMFSLAIQSIGMTSASLMIVALRIKVNWKLILWISLGGILGILLGAVVLFPLMNPTSLKIIFSSMVGVFGIVLWSQRNKGQNSNTTDLTNWSKSDKLILLLTGFCGGVISGLVGNGIDVVSFTVMVLLFGICEKSATPNSVILMAINAVAGLFIHQFILGDFTNPVTNYWYAAAPVVVLGAPLGAIICKWISPKQLVRILLVLIGLEVLFTLILIDHSPVNTIIFLASSIFFWISFAVMKNSRRTREQLINSKAT